uniref:Uncharacterized protein n=1 Tax=Oryza brachyantha TaxID=4533 RepID=J3NDY1_ORYBR
MLDAILNLRALIPGYFESNSISWLESVPCVARWSVAAVPSQYWPSPSVIVVVRRQILCRNVLGVEE